MNRSESFAMDQVLTLAIHLPLSSVELMADDVNEFQLMFSGAEGLLADVRVALREGVLSVEQPTYKAAMASMGERWMQTFVRVPRSWKGAVDASTIEGALSCRGLSGTDMTLDSIRGNVTASHLKVIDLNMRSVTGQIMVHDVIGENFSLRTVSGQGDADGLNFRSLRATSVSGSLRLTVTEAFEKLEGNSVSGVLRVAMPMDRVDAVLRTVSGRLRTENVSISEGAPKVNISTVTGDLELINTL